jgi:ubiquitin-conjugating enzyme E2 R
LEAEKDNVVVPTTMEEYCMKSKPLRPAQDSIEMDDFYDDDCYDLDDEEDEDEDQESSDSEEKEHQKDKSYDDAEDSGNGES